VWQTSAEVCRKLYGKRLSRADGCGGLTPFFEWAGTLANIIEPAGFGEYSPAFFHAEVGADPFLLPVEWGILL